MLGTWIDCCICVLRWDLVLEMQMMVYLISLDMVDIVLWQCC